MHAHTKVAGKTQPSVQRIALVGNPNVGKSAIFGLLTGRYVTVSNYPGTTVEIVQGNASLDGSPSLIIDTPGANSLCPMSEDEKVTRDILLHERPDVVVQVADAKNLKRALIISTQLSELETPFVLVLNMEDEARSRGVSINMKSLASLLGVPVTPTVATQRKGLDRLIRSLTAADTSVLEVTYDKAIEAAIARIAPLLDGVGPGTRGIALMLLSGDESLTSWLHSKVSESAVKEIETIRQRLQKHYRESLSYVIGLQRLRYIDRLLGDVISTDRPGADAVRPLHRRMQSTHPIMGMVLIAAALWGLHTLSGMNPLYAILSLPVLVLTLYFFSSWGTHPVYGIPILAVVLYLTWLFVGSFGAGTLVDLLETRLFEAYVHPFATKLASFIPWPLVREMLVGEYGAITMALTYAIAIVLPIVGAFFITFGVLEDSGYLPRLAIMVNRIFKVMGLNGKAALPMVLGLGCDTMATLTCRILETRRERVIATLLLALGIPCSAQLGVILGILGSAPIAATMIWLGVVVGVIFIVGFLASKLMPGQSPDFILELPPVRWPQMYNIVVKTLARVEWYVREAVPLFILGTLMLFAFSKAGILSGIESFAAPVVQNFLGLPPKATEAFVVGFLRRDYGAAGLYGMAQAGQLTNLQAVVSLVTITLFVPCVANFFVIIKERGLGVAIAMSAFIVPFAFLVGGLLNLTLRALGVTL